MAKNITILKQSLSAQGGLEKHTLKIADAFQKKGLNVRILCENAPQDKFPFSIHRLPSPSAFKFLKLIKFDKQCNRWLKKNDSDIIFGMERHRYQTHLRAGNGVHRAFFERRALLDSSSKRFFSHFNPLHKSILQFEKEAFEHPDLRVLFTNSNMVKKEILTYFNTDPRKIKVIHNGVEWYESQKDFDGWIERKPAICRYLDIDPSLFHFLFVGHGFYRKGLKPLLEALALLPNRDFQLSVIGKDKHTNDFILLAHKLGLDRQVSFYGARDDVRKFYQIADCVVIPSFYDPFANVTIEALNMGIFVLSSPNNGGCEILEPNTGMIVSSVLEKEAFALSLLQAMNYPKTWMRSQEIRQTVRHYDFSVQLKTLVDTTLSI